MMTARMGLTAYRKRIVSVGGRPRFLFSASFFHVSDGFGMNRSDLLFQDRMTADLYSTDRRVRESSAGENPAIELITSG